MHLNISMRQKIPVFCVSKNRRSRLEEVDGGNTPKSCFMEDVTSDLALKYQVAAECVKQILTIWYFTIYTKLIRASALAFLNQINTGQADGTPGLDLNVAEAWELGYTGKGVTIGIMDDGEYSKSFIHLEPSVSFACLWNGKDPSFGSQR